MTRYVEFDRLTKLRNKALLPKYQHGQHFEYLERKRRMEDRLPPTGMEVELPSNIRRPLVFLRDAANLPIA